MSTGLGWLQLEIKKVLNHCASEGEPALKPNDLYIAFAGDALPRSIRRALKVLVERGEVLHISKNAQGQETVFFNQHRRKTPGRYITVEAYIGLMEAHAGRGDGTPLADVAEAKRKWREMHIH